MTKRKHKPAAEGTKRTQFTAAQVKVLIKAVKSTSKAAVFTEKEDREAIIILSKLA